MNRRDQMLKWTGVAALLLGALPAVIVVIRDLPGAMREVKGMRMGHNGGWHSAH